MRRVLCQQRRSSRGPAGRRFVMKSSTLLVKPDVAGNLAENQAASLLRIAVIRRRVNVKPDVLHVSEIAAELLDHFVAGSFGAET